MPCHYRRTSVSMPDAAASAAPVGAGTLAAADNALFQSLPLLRCDSPDQRCSVQTLELPANISAQVVFRKEVASLEHLGWTRTLVRDTCVVDGVSYGTREQARRRFGLNNCC